MIDDAELLRRYAGAGSEAAFTELVGRHINLVYFTALRRTGESALAQDVTQSVFSTAARKSAGLAGHPSVAGWLYMTTRHLADKAVRKEQTRRRYEWDAAMHELTTAEPSREWERLRPIIDDALDGLDERDREVILIRFFEGRPFADIGATLRISQDAARMRVDRALEKLRTTLEKRGIHSASAALAVALSTQTGIAAPAAMITAVSGVAMATTAGTGGAAALLGFMSTTKTTVVAATLATILTSGFGIAERNRAQAAETRLDAMNREQISLRTRLAQAEKHLSQAETRAANAEKDNDSLLAAVEAASAVKAAAQRPSLVVDPATQNLGAMFPSGIVVTMGDKTITVDDVGRELAPLLPELHQKVSDGKEFSLRLTMLQNDIVKSLVERNLLIKQFSIPPEGQEPRHVPATVVDRALADTLREQFSNDLTKFSAYLDSRGMTPDQYRKTVEEDIIYSYMAQQQRKVYKDIQKKTANSAQPSGGR